MSTKKRKNIACYFKCSTSPLLWILLKCPHWAAKNDMLHGRWWTGMWTIFFRIETVLIPGQPLWSLLLVWVPKVAQIQNLRRFALMYGIWFGSDLLQNLRRFTLKDEFWFGRMIFSHTWSKLPPSTTPLDFLIGKLLLLPFSIVIRGLVGGQEVRSL